MENVLLTTIARHVCQYAAAKQVPQEWDVLSPCFRTKGAVFLFETETLLTVFVPSPKTGINLLYRIYSLLETEQQRSLHACFGRGEINHGRSIPFPLPNPGGTGFFCVVEKVLDTSFAILAEKIRETSGL